MSRFHLVPWSLVSVCVLAVAGCSRPATPQAEEKSSKPQAAPKDLCELLTTQELEKILGERPNSIQKSFTTSGGFTISQCFVNMPTYSNSVSFQVTRRAPGPGGIDPRAFLEKKIDEREKGEEGEKERPLDLVPNLGDKAIWMGTAVGGTFYVLKDNYFVRISVGTLKEPTKRREKAIELARLVIGRL